MDRQQILSKIKKAGLRSYMYPAISSLLLVVLIILVVAAGRYLSNNINRIFSLSDATAESQLIRVNFDNLNFVANKLGLEVGPDDQTGGSPAPETGPTPGGGEPLGPPAPVYETPAPVVENKTELKIEVLNSTNTAGLAGQLKTSLEQAGFVVGKVGNLSPTLPTTVIKVKQSAAAGFPQSIAELEQAVAAKYTLDPRQTLPADSAVDIQVIIGNK